MNPQLAQYEAIAKEIFQRCLIEDYDPTEMHEWLVKAIAHVGGAADDNALMTWEESFALVDKMQAHYKELASIPPEQRKILDWPWTSWNKLIDPLEPGILAVITAPDGMGKTIYAELIAEHWASHKNRVVYVHYELSKEVMMLRRTARHASLTIRDQKNGKLTTTQENAIAESHKRLRSWGGEISYLHTPGWTMERTTAELTKLHSEGNCDAVIIDYLEKVAASRRQMNMFGNDIYSREADNVEQLKIFSETTGVPIVQVAQMNKEGKGETKKTVDRNAIRGSGQKSEKSNIVILISRDHLEEGYSNLCTVRIDKNTLGPTGTLTQVMVPEYFSVGDPTGAGGGNV
jgi:replicative DNA helicase